MAKEKVDFINTKFNKPNGNQQSNLQCLQYTSSQTMTSFSTLTSIRFSVNIKQVFHMPRLKSDKIGVVVFPTVHTIDVDTYQSPRTQWNYL